MAGFGAVFRVFFFCSRSRSNESVYKMYLYVLFVYLYLLAIEVMINIPCFIGEKCLILYHVVKYFFV